MLDNLVNADLSGLTGKILYTYDSNSAMIPQVISSFGMVIVLLVLVVGIVSFLKITKTRRYREGLVDLYVASTIRKFAKEDGLDLHEEYVNFMRDMKKKKLEDKGLSRVVEDELSEKVISEQEKKLNKSDKETKK